ncbi:MAG TPA: DoxX family protein [Ktedonobacterales bacterium]|jgi:putative oxidoreductase|nr:DoxX family protein [Ktedonobacterales bacterium]
MAWALLIIRLVVGLTLMAHGMQKLLGWFGGPGFEKVSRGFDGRGLKPGWLWAGLAVLGEVGGGLSLALGFLTPLGAAGALGAMAMAIQTHWKKGFFNSKGGFEYPLALLAMSLAVGIAGAGAYSLDSLFNIALPEVQVFGILTVAAIVVDVVGILLSRSAVASPPASTAPAA